MFVCHANAFAIRPGRVLGRKLQHFTPAHLFWLEAINSPFLWKSDSPWSECATLDRLLIACLICSTPARKVRRMTMFPRWWIAECFLWGIVIRLLRYDLEAAKFAMRRYVDTYMDAPQSIRKEGNIFTGSAFPFSVSIVWTLMERMPEKQAWCVSMPLALAYVGRQAEYNGAEFLSERASAFPCVSEVKEGA